MRRILLASIAALLLALGLTVPAQGATTWSSVRSVHDSSGNGNLTLYYRVRTDADVGFKIEGVTISAGSPVLLSGIDGKGLSCWNENNTVKFSKDGSQTNLNPGQSRHWDTEIEMTGAIKLACGWFWTEQYIGPNGNWSVNQCAKVIEWRSGIEFTGGCDA